MKKRLILTALMASILLTSGMSYAKATQLKVGLITGTPPNYKLPFVSRGHFKQFNGISVDVWKKVAKLNHYQYRFIPIEANYTQAINDLKNGKYDVLVGALSITPQRQKIVDFSKTFFMNDLEASVQRKNPQTRPLLNTVYQNPHNIIYTAFKDITMSVAANTSSEALARKLSNKVSTTPALYDSLKKLAYGDVVTAMGDGVLSSVIIHQNPHWNIKLINIVLKQDPYAFGLPKNSPLKAGINTALDKINASGELKKTCQPYTLFVPIKMNLVEHCKVGGAGVS